MKQWFFLYHRRYRGPYKEDELLQKLLKAEVNKETLLVAEEDLNQGKIVYQKLGDVFKERIENLKEQLQKSPTSNPKVSDYREIKEDFSEEFNEEVSRVFSMAIEPVDLISSSKIKTKEQNENPLYRQDTVETEVQGESTAWYNQNRAWLYGGALSLVLVSFIVFMLGGLKDRFNDSSAAPKEEVSQNKETRVQAEKAAQISAPAKQRVRTPRGMKSASPSTTLAVRNAEKEEDSAELEELRRKRREALTKKKSKAAEAEAEEEEVLESVDEEQAAEDNSEQDDREASSDDEFQNEGE